MDHDIDGFSYRNPYMQWLVIMASVDGLWDQASKTPDVEPRLWGFDRPCLFYRCRWPRRGEARGLDEPDSRRVDFSPTEQAIRILLLQSPVCPPTTFTYRRDDCPAHQDHEPRLALAIGIDRKERGGRIPTALVLHQASCSPDPIIHLPKPS